MVLPNEEGSREFEITHKTAKGPTTTARSHVFCPTCKRAMYSIWVYGAVTPAVYNTNFCVCDGRWEGWDAADIERNRDLVRETVEPPVTKAKKKSG